MNLCADGMADAARIRPFLPAMPDNRHWALGEPFGHPWQAGQLLADRARSGGI